MRSLLHSASVQWRAGCQSPPSPPGGPSCPCMLFVSKLTESISITAHLFKKVPTMQEENLLHNNIFYQLLFNNAMVQCTDNICWDKYKIAFHFSNRHAQLMLWGGIQWANTMLSPLRKAAFQADQM